MKFNFLFFFIFIGYQCLSQGKSTFSFEANYGLQGNFFVKSYDEDNTPYAQSFYNKNFIGSIGGVAIKYNFNKNSSLALGYDKSVNQREIDYAEQFGGASFAIRDFHIRHTNYFFQLSYEHSIPTKKSKWTLGAGLVYARMLQQEIDISGNPPGILLEERNFKSNGLEEGGVFIGIQHSWPIDKHFELGIRSKIFYLISVNTLEAITLTPTLTYTFHKKS